MEIPLIEKIMTALSVNTQTKMAEILRVSPDRIKSLVNGRAKGLSLEEMKILVKEHNINAEWLITFEGNIFRGEKITPKNDGFNGEFSCIPVRNVTVSAGDGANNDNENVLYHFAYRKDWLKSRGLFEKDLEIIVVRGDSMEPTISDGDSILINTAENEPQDGHIYVIRSGETLWVKRVQRMLDGSLSLISDNKMYAPMILDLESTPDVKIIGKVVNSSKNFY
ncbi:LexA family transcriptional regulator [Acinetobacter junii]|uniref:LexA family transcriptional regulator n=1 Tax=Acinetobacter junii TaxID=40215 RepID=UPI000B0FD298|nr:S24 family peptidase [Acinetobacter junii]MDU2409713.1 S24 family peptidase [Acinetobacter junii]